MKKRSKNRDIHSRGNDFVFTNMAFFRWIFYFALKKIKPNPNRKKKFLAKKEDREKWRWLDPRFQITLGKKWEIKYTHIHNTQHVLTRLFFRYRTCMFIPWWTSIKESIWPKMMMMKQKKVNNWCASAMAERINAKRHQPCLPFSFGWCVHFRHHVNTFHNFSTRCNMQALHTRKSVKN